MDAFDDRSPIFAQIAESIRRAVASGELDEGEQVMSTTQYATTYRINPATAAKAMALLVDEGVLHKRRGVGMFVNEGARELLRQRGREHFWQDAFDPVVRQADSLGISREQLIDRIAQSPSHTEGGRP